MFLLRSRRPARFGKWTDRLLAPEPFAQVESDDRLERALLNVEEFGDDLDEETKAEASCARVDP